MTAPLACSGTVQIPGTSANTTGGKLYVFDISWVDQPSRTYYLADRSNAVVDIVDTTSGFLMFQLTGGFKGFTGNNGTSGPNGVTTGGHCLFVTDAPSRVVSFDTTAFPPTQVSAVSTADMDPNRADELAYELRRWVDPGDQQRRHSAVRHVDQGQYNNLCPHPADRAAAGGHSPGLDLFNAAGGVNATNGAEQPQWDPDTGKFYLSIPQIGLNPSSGGVVRINPTTAKIEKTYPISFCSPAGLTKGPNHDFLVGCNTVFDAVGNLWTVNDPNVAAPIQVILNVQSGATDQVAGVGVGDEVWFNKGDGNYYTASSTSPLRPLDVTGAADAQGAAILGVIDAKDEEVLQLAPTFNVPAVATGSNPHPASTAHSVAADSG